jgi:hypothetical protein
MIASSLDLLEELSLPSAKQSDLSQIKSGFPRLEQASLKTNPYQYR